MGAPWVPKADVLTFLLRVKRLVQTGRWEHLDRSKTLAFLSRHGLLLADVADVVLGLTPRDYFNGPERVGDPRLPPGLFWEFAPDVEVDGTLRKLYVKLEIVERADEQLLVLSFHEAESYRVVYPYRT